MLNGDRSNKIDFPVAIWERIFPVKLANLKPWPEQGLAIIMFLYCG
jgi:hypothetical protein